MLLCPAFTDVRHKLIHMVSTVYNGFNDMSNDEKLIFLDSEPSVYRFIAKSCHIMLQKWRQILFINPCVCPCVLLKLIMYKYIIYH